MRKIKKIKHFLHGKLRYGILTEDIWNAVFKGNGKIAFFVKIDVAHLKKYLNGTDFKINNCRNKVEIEKITIS